MAKRIKLVFLIDSLSSGGTQQALLDLISELPSSDFEVSVVSLTAHNDFYSERLKKFSSVYFAQKKLNSIRTCFNPFFWMHLHKLIKSLKPDILHARLNGSALFASVLCRIQKIPHFVFTIEGSIAQHSKGIAFFYRFFLKNADAIFTHYAVEYRKMGLPEAKLRKYQVGILIPSELKEPVFKINLQDRFPVLLSVGRLHEEKGHQFAIETTKNLKADFPNILLCICGEGAYQTELKQKVEQLELSDSVYFAGFVMNIDWFYANSHFYLNFALNEPPNLSNLKAPFYGVPAIVFDNGFETHFKIQNDVNGYLVPKKSVQDAVDRLKKTLKDPARYEALRESSRQSFSEEFLQTNITGKYESFYKKLAECRA